MEKITATTLSRELASFDDSAALGYDPTGLILHEAAHQWFGDLVTCRDWAHIWLNEGFATYFTAYALEREHGVARRQEAMAGYLKWYLRETGKYERPLVTYLFDRPGSMFDAHTYAKGAWVLHMLRVELTDAVFRAGVARYLDRATDGLADTHDLRRAMEAASGRDLGAFFAQWVHGAGHPVLEVNIRDVPAAQKIRMQIKQKQPKLFSFSVMVRIAYAEGRAEVRHVQVSEKSQVVMLPRRSPPRLIEVDPRGDLLGTLTLKAPGALLRAQARHGSSAWSRSAAAHALGSQTKHASEDVTALAVLLASSSQPRMVRRAAAAALGEIADPSACVALAAGTRFKRPTAGDAARVRAAVAEALSDCDDKLSTGALLEVAKSDVSVHVKSKALASVGEALGKDSPRSLLIDAMQANSWRGIVAGGAAAGLASIDAKWARQALLRAVGSTKTPLVNRRAIAAKLKPAAKPGKAAGRAVVRTLRTIVAKDADPTLIRNALRVLVKIGDRSDVERLEAGIARLPQKWHHKEADRWRRTLKATITARKKKRPKAPKRSK